MLKIKDAAKLHKFLKQSKYVKYEKEYDINSAYWIGFRDAIIESYIFGRNNKHHIRKFFYQTGKYIYEAKTHNSQRSSLSYFAGYSSGRASEWFFK